MLVAAKPIPPDDERMAPACTDGGRANVGGSTGNEAAQVLEAATRSDAVATTAVIPFATSLARRPGIGKDDSVQLARLAGGETAAFQTLMQRHLSAVLATARRIVRDEAEAEDIAQEAFLRLWHQAGGLEAGERGIRPWLCRVAANLAIDGLRKARRFDVTDDVPEQIDPARQLVALEALDVTARIDEALALLPQRQRIALSLFHYEELPQRDVARLMEVSEDALESLLARGRRRLRELLKNDWQSLLADDSDVP